MECSRCKSDKIINNGKVRNKQRYYCKSCRFNFVEVDQRRGKNIEKQKMAIQFYLENMGFRAIGSVLGVSNVTVLNWIRTAGEAIEENHKQNKDKARESTEIIEMEEMWHYTGKKRKLWVWFGLNRTRTTIIDFVTGSREASTGKKLWNKIKDIDCKLFYSTDDWPAYEQSIDKNKHKISKKETTCIESHNSNVRHYLARFRRKTKCYSKSERLVQLSLYLLMYKSFILSIF